MFYHGNTQVFIEPGTGELRYQNINQDGSIARGKIWALDAQTIIWNWNAESVSGTTTAFRVRQEFKARDEYRMQLSKRDADGSWQAINDLAFHRVVESPTVFKRLRSVK